MLKRYAETDRIRWSGKAWEIGRALQVLTREKGRSARLKELLPGAHSRAVVETGGAKRK
ncbi:hypothetical protein [Cohnella sp. JJ-181]|uniref:hypothetical protein n=1 Tax=Cohnella rhizoplanae TaxID=2974897 RepID=UPI0022FF9CBB|nr:hypothetical protein [Cohnella sp. JJ-181]CAI6056631.1 hypothetical protein COHCIP112018_01703 [Cohnella sp. JJ-181]